MSDEPEARPATAVRRSVGHASGEVALAGQDGKELARLIRASKARGVKVMADVMGFALARYKGVGPVLTRPDLDRLSDAFAAVNATAELLGRSRVREVAGRAKLWEGSHKGPPDAPFSSFADAPAGVIVSPGQAVEYFTSLHPELGVDPRRFGQSLRRQAFTLAESTNQVLTKKVQQLIANSMWNSAGSAEATAKIRQALEDAGVSPKNPQYAEMVFRTNAMDAFQQGVYEEGRSPDVADLFPAWEYLGIKDGRQGKDHEPKFGRFYPASASFAEVRGDRPFNCRCSMRWVDSFEWEDLQRQGKTLEGKW